MTLLPAFTGRRTARWIAAALAALAAAAVVSANASAQRAGRDDEEQGSSDRVFSADVGELVVSAQEKTALEPPDNQGALADLNRALNNENPTEYELGVILYMRGGIKYQLDDTQGALADWNRALSEGDLNESERLNLMFNVGQLYLSEGDYREAVDRIEEWIRAGGMPNDGVHLNLVAAYVELGEWQNALRHARAAYEIASPRQKKHYDTLNYLYTEMNMPAERAELLSEMVVLFPQEKDVWRSIAALHFEAGRDRKAFEINKIMYLNGMLTTEQEIMAVVDYYSFFEVPYRGARILEREMNAGRIERDQDNLEKLARLYRQANEFDRAIPSLEAAARMSPDGELFQTLGEAYYAEARLSEAEGALLQAIQKGGLDKPGDVWVVIGTTRYEQGDLDGAIEAFEQGERFSYSRDDARDWREFVEQQKRIARDQAEFALNVAKEEVRVRCERLIADIVLWNEMFNSSDYEGPDCIAVARRGDYTSDPHIVELQAEFDAEFNPEVADASDAAPEAAAEDDAEGTETNAGR